MVTPRGRRPGKHDTRADVLEAARAAFREEGYDGTTIRSIARRAGVDPALVHHYFGDKASLFVAVVDLARDPRDVSRQVDAALAEHGAALVRAFLDLWEGPESSGAPGSSFVALVQATSAAPATADAVREFLSERVWNGAGHAPDGSWAPALLCSQLAGLAWARYVLRVDPLASSSLDEIAALVGPTLDRYALLGE